MRRVFREGAQGLVVSQVIDRDEIPIRLRLSPSYKARNTFRPIRP